MDLNQIETKCWILALFIRDDGKRFLLGSGAYEFVDNQQHFAPNAINNDVVEVQGNDGSLLAGTVRRATTQKFDGYVGDASCSKSDIEQYRRDFFRFFRKDHFYKVVYIFQDGTAMQRTRGFLVDAPAVQELFQYFPKYHVAFNFEDVNYYYYEEDEYGQEIYGKSAKVYSSEVTDGGLVWDGVGAKWDDIGAVWQSGGAGGPTILAVDSIEDVSPLLTITGETVNPVFTNITTGTSIQFNGTVANGQTLVIDMNEQTALLDGTSVISNITGDWIILTGGNNTITYSASNSDIPPATVQWQEILG